MDAGATSAEAAEATNPKSEGRDRLWHEGVIHAGLLLCACVSIFTSIAIVFVLLHGALLFFADVSLVEFFTSTQWSPTIKPQHFGVLSLVCGTLLVTVGAGLVGLPLGLGTAVYLGEYAGHRVRDVVKPVLEILAGVPSVVYGYMAVVVISPWIRWLFPSARPFNAASASVVVGIMILPMVVSLSEDVLRAVPRSLREAAYALGATKFDVTVRVVLPAAASGIFASFLLALSRAIGETMAVTLAAGATPKMTFNPLESIQTMTAYIVQMSKGETPVGTPEYYSLFAVGLVLFAMTMLMNIASQWILKRVRNRYE